MLRGRAQVYSDLWSLNASARPAAFAWEAGPAQTDRGGRWGAGAAPQRPGARYAGETWADTRRGALWLFGGWGHDAANSTGYLNDVWRYTV